MQLKPRINAHLEGRFSQMIESRASVGEVMRVHKALLERTSDFDDPAEKLRSDQALERLIAFTDVEKALAGHYRTEVFKNNSYADRADANVSQFDLYNVLTEAATHTTSSVRSDNSVQMAINRLVFDDVNRRQTLESRSAPIAQESDPERAFFSISGIVLAR